MLKVAIHGDHVFASAVGEPSRQRSSLTEVSAQPHSDYVRVDFGQFLEQLVGKILLPSSTKTNW